MTLKNFLFSISIICSSLIFAQQVPDTNIVSTKSGIVSYETVKSYTLEDIVITGTSYYDKSVLQSLTGLMIGQKIKIPGDDVSKVITNMWKQKLFDDVSVSIQDVHDDKIVLGVNLREKPRLSSFSIKGLSKGKANSLREEITLKSGQIITDNVLATVSNEIKKYFAEKGFLDTDVKFEQEKEDPKKNTAKLRIIVDRGNKIKIHDIRFTGNKSMTDKELRKLLKDTKRKKAWFAKSRYDEAKYTEDKQHIIEKYLTMGYRDIEITSDSVYRYDKSLLEIVIHIYEGSKYYFRNI